MSRTGAPNSRRAIRSINTYALVAGIIASGNPGDTWTITKKGGKGLYFCSPCAITVDDLTEGNTYPNDRSGYPSTAPFSSPRRS